MTSPTPCPTSPAATVAWPSTRCSFARRNRPGELPASRGHAFVVEPEEGNHLGHVLRPPYRAAHPPRIRQHVMRQGAARADELVSDPSRKGEVGEGVAVQVAELDPAETELDASEPMGRDGHPRPAADL